MKIKLIKPWQNGQKLYPVGTTIGMVDGDARALIAQGFACEAPDDARLRMGDTEGADDPFCAPAPAAKVSKNPKAENPGDFLNKAETPQTD